MPDRTHKATDAERAMEANAQSRISQGEAVDDERAKLEREDQAPGPKTPPKPPAEPTSRRRRR